MPRQNAGRSMSLTSPESYSAVIIADMIAEVPTAPEHMDIEQGRKNSARFENGVDATNSPGKKVEINHGYDDQTELAPPAVINVDTMEINNINTNRVNGTDISKGVILNAQFGSLNKNSDNHITEKSIELNSTQPERDSDAKKEPEDKVPTDFKHMSGPRKVAFIFSFLPSIMFVLCFAVILPCETKLPCIQEMWSQTLNDTKITSPLSLSSDKLFYSYIDEKIGLGLASLDVENGKQVWNNSLSYIAYLKGCENLIDNNTKACLVERAGVFNLFNASSGDQLLEFGVDLSKPIDSVILPDCLGQGISEYGFATSPEEIQIIYQGNMSSSIIVPNCDTEPKKLTPWTTKNNQTDLIFVCRKSGKDQLIRMAQSTWCSYENKGSSVIETSVLKTGDAGSFENVTFLPTPNGLIVWDQDEVTFFGVNGEKNWTVPSDSNFNLNRFIFQGKFRDSRSEIALFSNNASSTLHVSLLDYETGKITWNKTTQNTEIFDIVLMNGEKKDFVLMLRRKVEGDLKAEAASQLTEVPTTIMSLLAKDSVTKETDESKATLVDETIFMELGSDYSQTVDKKIMNYSEGKYYNGTLTVVHRPNKDIAIVTLRQSDFSYPHSLLKSISVSNWDISIIENRQCS